MEATEEPQQGLNVRYREEDGTVFFESYIPPARDAIHLPPHVLYMLIASFIVLLVLYAIIGHLIKDLFHDFADWLYGKQPEEVVHNFCEAKDKFMVDWCPETSPELEAMAKAEQSKMILEDFRQHMNNEPVWVIPDRTDPQFARTAPRVAFGRS